MTFTTIMAYPATANLPISDFGVKSPYLMIYFIWNVYGIGSMTVEKLVELFGMEYIIHIPHQELTLWLSLQQSICIMQRVRSIESTGNFTDDHNGDHVPTIKLAYIASDFDISSKFEKSIAPIPIVINDNVTIPPGTCFVHVDDVISSIGPQKKPNPLNENKTINSLPIGAISLAGQMSPCISKHYNELGYTNAEVRTEYVQSLFYRAAREKLTSW